VSRSSLLPLPPIHFHWLGEGGGRCLLCCPRHGRAPKVVGREPKAAAAAGAVTWGGPGAGGPAPPRGSGQGRAGGGGPRPCPASRCRQPPPHGGPRGEAATIVPKSPPSLSGGSHCLGTRKNDYRDLLGGSQANVLRLLAL